jgi:hypothetical protein
MKCWESIADPSKQSWFVVGCSSEIDGSGRVLHTADAYRRDLKAFRELERIAHVMSDVREHIRRC